MRLQSAHIRLFEKLSAVPVAQQFLVQYIDSFIYSLPSSDKLEWSLRRAVDGHGLQTRLGCYWA